MKKRYFILGIVAIVAVISYRGIFLDFGVGLPGEDIVERHTNNEALTASVVDVSPQTEEVEKHIEITGDGDVDRYIIALAENRGYEKQQSAPEEALEYIQGQELLPGVIFDFQSLKSKMEDSGMNLILISGYRSPDRQRQIFLKKLGIYNRESLLSGELDQQIDQILSQSSIPGYSKHHTGRAIDVGCDNYILDYSFTNSPCYTWLAENDFEKAEAYNFSPSYPFGIENQGPDPEPWEFVWEG